MTRTNGNEPNVPLPPSVPIPRPKARSLILWPQSDGTSRTIEADDIRALVGYVGASS